MSGPVTIQPGHKLLPANAEWSTELFASCRIIYCICKSWCAGRLHKRAGESFLGCLVPGATQALRTKIRMAYGIKGTLVSDWLSSCCCPCSLLQMKKELDRQGVPDPYAK
ncbi:unnamed protein product [Didymodactylos carnosus]|uniref:Uncharacterized protein n=1 Tax=Didymodactylos carnosus TaxID=1234261 RepID=A0A814Q3G8_9BILA|nr:unnamed protein product [Didymodactylos carnosus]CAF1114225.1 unnamed protein product [Didymodactylos carnosus]CAF3607675.1 unnamed protein product [Didymodactylos carnosus]CAF3878328.1 unnamed protein product [Didymodactylos carnosus]